jgi:hypothetical protein
MKARRIRRGEKLAPGMVLTRDLGLLRKGRVLAAEDLPGVESVAFTELDVLELEPEICTRIPPDAGWRRRWRARASAPEKWKAARFRWSRAAGGWWSWMPGGSPGST